MNKTMYLGVNLNSWFEQAVDGDQSLHFCVHIFDRARNGIVVTGGLQH